MAGVFATQVALFGMSLTTGVLVARILGTQGMGTYAAIVTLPAMLSALSMFGLPGAVNYFTGKGHAIGSLVRATYLFTVVASVVIVAFAWLALPLLEGSILSAARDSDSLLRLMVLMIPLGMLTAFGGSILYGRQAVRTYNLIQVGMGALTLGWAIVVVGQLNLGIRGAVFGAVVVSVLTAVLVMTAVHRLGRAHPGGPPVTLRGLAAYGARSYPGSLSGYFSYRADTYILQATVANPKGPLGLYNRAVSMDELVFYVPNSVSTLFLPRVAGSSTDQSSAMVARVGRFTTLLTVCAALCLIPVAYAGIHLVLPAFVDCLPAFLILLPGVVSLSIGKVMTSYVSGRGRPGRVAAGTTASLVLNLICNIALIPRFGITGAALSSVISYTLQASIAVFFASRLSGQPPLALFVPGRGEVKLLVATVPRILRAVPLARRWRSAASSTDVMK